MTKKKGLGDLPFTYESLMKDLDQYRGSVTWNNITGEQRDFIIKCREHPQPISFPKMAVLWEKLEWGKIKGNSIQNIYDKIKENL